MEHKTSKTIQIESRHGFHILADQFQSDPSFVENFIPFAQATACSHILVEVLDLQALPVSAIRALVENDIAVDVFLKTNLQDDFDLLAYQDFISNLAGLQVSRLILFDRPNQQPFWKPDIWVKPNLVDFFLEKFILLAEQCLEKNIQPSFPPLQPGGDYWDTAFLRLALQTLLDKGKQALLAGLTLSAYTWSYGHPLDWGAGGPERWPATIPYFTPADSQDQLGFRIFDWYETNSKAVLDHTLPIILLQTGRDGEYGKSGADASSNHQVMVLQDILEMLYPEIYGSSLEEQKVLEALPAEIVQCNFLLDLDRETITGLFKPTGTAKFTQRNASAAPEEKSIPPSSNQHYLLLPDESWLSDPFKESALEPFVHQFHPRMGTSLDEALDAREVTLVITAAGEAAEQFDILQQQEHIFLRKMRVEVPAVVEENHDR